MFFWPTDYVPSLSTRSLKRTDFLEGGKALGEREIMQYQYYYVSSISASPIPPTTSMGHLTGHFFFCHFFVAGGNGTRAGETMCVMEEE